ncbi:phytanoyl-CoA dioxygenase family protein [Aquabacterium sp.]|uniref:phytanoyl-CoA dioxygenase family protein n=1 Tax=Aquabacterium sp. TaxID=1872578 RepID=UPI002C05E976|nr:phytanoyl-CoA dioxygenase family protein [Aquabacterium sp.]HSW04944.1 phytanoyl-CoA dioxygenase family protein [Aquabacterium sp.]
MTTQLKLPAPTRDVEQGQRDLAEYGLCVHEGFVEGEQLKALRERLVEQAELECEYGVGLLSSQSRGAGTWYGRPEPGAMPGWQGIPALYNKGRVFIDYLKHPLFAAYNQQLFRGASWHLSAMTGLIVRRGAEPMVVHVDQQFMPWTEVPTYLNCMLCLTEFEEVMGATRVVPKSHLGGYPKQAYSAERGAHNPEPIGTVAVEAPAGSVIFFESRTWHQSGISTSDKTRLSLTTLWQQHWVKPMDNIALNLQREVHAGLSADELKLLGFCAEPSGRIEAATPDAFQNTNRKTPYVPELRRDSAARPVALDGMGDRKNRDDDARAMGLKAN